MDLVRWVVAVGSSEIEHVLLGDLPEGFVDGLDVVRDPWNFLKGAVVRDTTCVDVAVGISMST
jgi:hypothetical protein